MKLLGTTKSKITRNENGENVPNLEITEVILENCNIVNNNLQNSRVLYILAPNNSFGKLLDTSPKNVIILNIFNSEWLTDENSKPLEIEKISLKYQQISV